MMSLTSSSTCALAHICKFKVVESEEGLVVIYDATFRRKTINPSCDVKVILKVVESEE